MQMTESRIRLPSLTQLSIQSLLFLDYSVAIFLLLVLCAGLHHPSSSCLLIHHLTTERWSLSHRENLLPRASEDEGSAVSQKSAFQKGQSTRPSRIDGYELWMPHPNWSPCSEPRRVSLPLHPQAAFPFSMHFCIHFAWGPFLC